MQRFHTILDDLLRPLEPVPVTIDTHTSPLPSVKAVLFDVYGTLLVSASGDVGSAQGRTGAEFFYQSLSPFFTSSANEAIGPNAEKLYFQIIEKYHASKRRDNVSSPEVDIRTVWEDLVTALMEKHLLNQQALEHIDIIALTYECLTNPVWPMPGFREIINEFNKNRISPGIVSNAQFYTPVILSWFMGRAHDKQGFDPALCEWSYARGESKPATGMFEKPLDWLRTKYGLLPEEVVYIGNDMLNDVYTASQAGLRTILFAGDKRSLRLRETDERIEGQGLYPDRIITSLYDLPKVLTHLK